MKTFFSFCAALVGVLGTFHAQSLTLDRAQVVPLASQASGARSFEIPGRVVTGPVSLPPGSKLDIPGVTKPTPNPSPGGGSCAANEAGSPCSQTAAATQSASTPDTGAGNPINVINGNKYQAQADIAALPGVLGLEWVRHYNSSFATTRTVPGSFGQGWRHSYDTRLFADGRGYQIVQADGSRLMFYRSASDPSLCQGTLATNGQIRQDGANTIWQWVDGRELMFNRHGRLLQIKARSGEFVSLFYDAQQRLTAVVDPQERRLDITYVSAASKQVASAVSPLGVFRYEYQRNNLIKVYSPKAPQATLYHYEDTRHPSHLTGISQLGQLPNQAAMQVRDSTYLYDETGKAVLSTKGEPARLAVNAVGTVVFPRRLMPGTGVEQVHLAFEQPPTPTRAGKTVLTNSVGEQTIYTHKIIAGEFKLLSVVGPGCSRCNTTNVRYEYDANGAVTKIISLNPKGEPIYALQQSLDSFNRLVQVRAAFYQNGVVQPWQTIRRFEYQDPDNAFTPTLVAQPSVIEGKEHQVHIEFNGAGQPQRMLESGFSPVASNEKMTYHPTLAQAIQRQRHLRYTTINGRSMLTQVVGPNGETDITQFEYDHRGSFITAATLPSGVRTQFTLDAAGAVQQISNSLGQTTTVNATNESIKVTQVAPNQVPTTATLLADAMGQLQQSALKVGPELLPSQLIQMGSEHQGTTQWVASPLQTAVQNIYDTEMRLKRTDFYSASTQVTKAAQTLVRSILLPSLDEQHHDDFKRLVATASPNSGLTLRQYNGADQLTAMGDANGHEAKYEYDPQGRIQRQVVIDARSKQESVTRWFYQGQQLVKVEHPTQDEVFEYDNQGRRSAKITTTKIGDSTFSWAQRYQYSATGDLIGVSLPTGHWLQYESDAQAQITGVSLAPTIRPWLKHFANTTALATKIARDNVGLAGFNRGNKSTTRWLRDIEGRLAQLVHNPLQSNLQPLQEDRFMWFESGELALQKTLNPNNSATEKQFVYDGAGQLVVAQDTMVNEGNIQPVSFNSEAEPKISRFAYDRLQRQRLAQQNGQTQQFEYENNSHRLKGRQYSAAGQLTQQGSRQYQWDAYGRLTAVSNDGQPLAQYQYDHRGLRIAKQVGSELTVYAYNDQHQLIAEIAGSGKQKGKVKRQYVYLADLPLAVIDFQSGAALQAQTTSAFGDLISAVHSKVIRGSTITWLHTNYLGAPVLATNQQGNTVWAAQYSPFGSVTTQRVSNQSFNQPLALPGQHYDPETGLHYNRQRYYDPTEGRYLSPDPIGHPDGPNPYAYAANDPLRFIDPDGLALFAFDGTGNTDVEEDLLTLKSSKSNVVRFAEAYDSGRKYYVTGVGTTHRDEWFPDEPIDPAKYAAGKFLDHITDKTPLSYVDMGGNYSGPARIERMVRLFEIEAKKLVSENKTVMDFDVIGFSRGAAQARDFSNRIKNLLLDNKYYVTDKYKPTRCLTINFRFMGLWDTVLSTNWNGARYDPADNVEYNLAVPSDFKYVAQAVALNEHRSGSILKYSSRKPLDWDQHWGGFPLESIGELSSVAGKVREERGFIGAHADIGGGYLEGENQLSFVALNWMVKQAEILNIKFKPPTSMAADKVALHDQSNAIRLGNPSIAAWPSCLGFIPCGLPVVAEDREVKGAFSGKTQRAMGFNNNSLTHAEAMKSKLIQYRDRDVFSKDIENKLHDPMNPYGFNLVTGHVDMDKYLDWLRKNGYTL